MKIQMGELRLEWKNLGDKMDTKFERLDNKFNKIDRKFERSDNKIDRLIFFLFLVEGRVRLLHEQGGSKRSRGRELCY